jgi:hypothetical protein
MPALTFLTQVQAAVAVLVALVATMLQQVRRLQVVMAVLAWPAR